MKAEKILNILLHRIVESERESQRLQDELESIRMSWSEERNNYENEINALKAKLRGYETGAKIATATSKKTK